MDLIKEVMDGLKFEAFALKLTEAGYFKGREGNIYWLGIEDNRTLFDMQKKLHESLLAKGFELENRKYKPHITIGRKVKLKDGFNINISELNDIAGKTEIYINKLDLMKSEFTNGKLGYSLVYSHEIST